MKYESIKYYSETYVRTSLYFWVQVLVFFCDCCQQQRKSVPFSKYLHNQIIYDNSNSDWHQTIQPTKPIRHTQTLCTHLGSHLIHRSLPTSILFYLQPRDTPTHSHLEPRSLSTYTHNVSLSKLILSQPHPISPGRHVEYRKVNDTCDHQDVTIRTALVINHPLCT